nr:hypothetical protein [Paenibacillus sp. IHB B 3084]
MAANKYDLNLRMDRLRLPGEFGSRLIGIRMSDKIKSIGSDSMSFNA